MNFNLSDLGGIFSFVCAAIVFIIGAVILFGALFIDLHDKKEQDFSHRTKHKILYLKDIVVLTRCLVFILSIYVFMEFFVTYKSFEGLTLTYCVTQGLCYLLVFIPVTIIGFKRKKQLALELEKNSDTQDIEIAKVCKKLKHLTTQLFEEFLVCSVCLVAMAFSLAFTYVVMTDKSYELTSII